MALRHNIERCFLPDRRRATRKPAAKEREREISAPHLRSEHLCAQRRTAAVGMFLRFFGLGIFADRIQNDGLLAETVR